jgi:hypothetical protein
MADPTTPNPDETTQPNPLEAKIHSLNEENAGRRLNEKKLQTALDAQTALVREVLGAFGVDSPEDLAPRLSEFRAAQAETKNPENDPKKLRAMLAQLQEELKTKAASEKDFKEKYETTSSKYRERTISKTIGDAIAAHGVKPAFAAALTAVLKDNVKLDDKDEVVWIQKDPKGNDLYEVSVKDGLEGFFKTNPDWLPADTPSGSGTQQNGRPKPATRTNIKEMTLEEYNAQRAVLTGIPDQKKVART